MKQISAEYLDELLVEVYSLFNMLEWKFFKFSGCLKHYQTFFSWIPVSNDALEI